LRSTENFTVAVKFSVDLNGCQWRRNIAENFNRLSRAHERYRQLTDRRQYIAKNSASLPSQGNPSVGGLNARGVAKYSDFGPIEGYISETVQGMR